MKRFSVAILTGTLNPDPAVFLRCLRAVRSQVYSDKITHYILDGGSRKATLELARKYHCRVLSFSNDKNEGLSRIYKVLPKIREDLILFLESDNIMTSKHWLSDMVSPFHDNRIFSTYSMHNAYAKSDNVVTRYFALMGAPDPTLYYLGKSDKVRMDEDTYDRGTLVQEKENYYTVKFQKDNLPVMGDNGFMIRTDICRRASRKEGAFYHTDVFARAIHMGYDMVGVVKNAIIHVSGSNILGQVKRRVDVKEYFTDELKGSRSYLVYNPASAADRRNLLLFVVCAGTLVQPLYVSIRGYLKIRDVAWFLHPAVCFLMALAYGSSEIRRLLHLDKQT